MFSSSGQHSQLHVLLLLAQPLPVSSPAESTARPLLGDGKQPVFNEVFAPISPLRQVFSSPYKRWWGYFVGLVFFSSSLFFFPGKREIKAVPSPWLSDLTGSPHYVFSFLLSLILSTMCLASAGVGDSLERILPPFPPRALQSIPASRAMLPLPGEHPSTALLQMHFAIT